MKVTGLPQTGNSAKFEVQTAKGVSFVLAFSFTLRTKIWQLPDVNAELAAATQIAEAIVGRHDPKLPFKSKYIFAEHNTQPTLEATVKYLRRSAIGAGETEVKKIGKNWLRADERGQAVYAGVAKKH